LPWLLPSGPDLVNKVALRENQQSLHWERCYPTRWRIIPVRSPNCKLLANRCCFLARLPLHSG